MRQEFIDSVRSELNNILAFWQQNAPDDSHGGSVGRIDHFGNVVPQASKGVILNTRILWAFSAASNHFKDNRFQDECERAYGYLKTHFKDAEYGGVYWELDYSGRPTDRRKQVYAQSFTIYALAEYYKYCRKPEVLDWAMELFQLTWKPMPSTWNRMATPRHSQKTGMPSMICA